VKAPATMRGCTAPKDKTSRRLLDIFKPVERCGAEVVRETPLGNFCAACLEETRENYDQSLLKMLRDRAGKTGNPFESAAEARTDSDWSIAVGLWNLLDDIDTYDDACRDNDAVFRRRARERLKMRHHFLVSDGYVLKRAPVMKT